MRKLRVVNNFILCLFVGITVISCQKNNDDMKNPLMNQIMQGKLVII